MAEKPDVSSAVVASATPLPQAAGATLHWDDSSGVCGDVEPRTFSESVRQLPFRPGDRRHHAVSSAFRPAERSLSPPAHMVPDNMGGNVRDRSGETPTPGDQSESAADRTLTQRIRQAVVADESLSTAAKNITIITINGVVTLRGPGQQSTGEREY